MSRNKAILTASLLLLGAGAVTAIPFSPVTPRVTLTESYGPRRFLAGEPATSPTPAPRGKAAGPVRVEPIPDADFAYRGRGGPVYAPAFHSAE